jgi:hypothetical protein
MNEIEQIKQSMMLNALVKQSAGNPGAAMALAELCKDGHYDAVARLIELDIKGTDIYVLYSDICDKSPLATACLIQECPAEILKDAASRQDYSGRELVKPYMRFQNT